MFGKRALSGRIHFGKIVNGVFSHTLYVTRLTRLVGDFTYRRVCQYIISLD